MRRVRSRTASNPRRRSLAKPTEALAALSSAPPAPHTRLLQTTVSVARPSPPCAPQLIARVASENVLASRARRALVAALLSLAATSSHCHSTVPPSRFDSHAQLLSVTFQYSACASKPLLRLRFSRRLFCLVCWWRCVCAVCCGRVGCGVSLSVVSAGQSGRARSQVHVVVSPHSQLVSSAEGAGPVREAAQAVAVPLRAVPSEGASTRAAATARPARHATAVGSGGAAGAVRHRVRSRVRAAVEARRGGGGGALVAAGDGDE